MFPLNNDLGRRLYCGPAAVCLLTGTPASRVEQMMRRARNEWHRKQTGRNYYRSGKRHQFKSAYNSEVLTVLRRLGCKLNRFPIGEHWKTLGKLCDDTKSMRNDFLVETPRHFMVVSRGKWADNSSPIPQDGHGRRLRVLSVWQVVAPAEPMQPTGIKPRVKPPRPQNNKQVDRALRVKQAVARWELKRRRAESALKKLMPKLMRYHKLGVL